MKLKEVDLSRGQGMNHPDFKPYPQQYLVKIGQGFHSGYFDFFDLQTRWIFIGGPWGSYQYDTPGTNCSDWKRVWEIIETEEEKVQMSDHEIEVAKRESLFNSLSDYEKELIEDGEYTLDQIIKFKKKREHVNSQ